MDTGGRTSSYDLIERFRAGDEDAFSLLFAKYRKRIAVLIHYKLGARARGRLEVDDLLQEVFFAASRDIQRFSYRSPGSFARWLATIAQHTIEDAVRFESRRKRDAGDRVTLAEPVDSKTPSRLFRGHEQVRLLLARLDALPDNYRSVILMAKFEGLSTAEMAERMGKTREAIALLLHRALVRYRELENK